MKRLLQISLLLNLGLLIGVGWRSVARSPMPRTLRTEVGTPVPKPSSRFFQRRASAPPPASAWAAIESTDPQRLMANLRAIGCPEQTIRDIVTLRICRAYRDRWVEREAEQARSWHYTRNPDWREVRKRAHQQSALRNEMIHTLESLFGEHWQTMSAAMLGWPERWRDATDFLDVEKRHQLRDLDLRYNQAKNDLDQKGWRGELDTEGAAQLRDLERQKQAELAAMLSPQELEEYLYRRSPAADYVRRNLPAAKSESEFRAMVKLALEFELGTLPGRPADLGLPPGDSDLAHAEAERQSAFEEQLKAVLGEARIAEQQIAEEQRLVEERQRQKAEDEQHALTQLAEMAASVGIAEADARRFFERLNELRPVLEPKFNDMEKNLTGTDEEKQKQMEIAIRAELETIAVEIMGEQGKALVEKMARPEK
jgi:hypothetical protein